MKKGVIGVVERVLSRAWGKQSGGRGEAMQGWAPEALGGSFSTARGPFQRGPAVHLPTEWPPELLRQ